MEAKVDNQFGGKSELELKTPIGIKLKLTDVSTWEMGLFVSGKDTTIICNHTISSPAKVSDITAYSPKWRLLNFSLPRFEVSDFIGTKQDSLSSDLRIITKKLHLCNLYSELQPEMKSATFRISTANLNKDENTKIAKFLKAVSCHWIENKFSK